MSPGDLNRTEPEGAAAAVAWRRLREAPVLALPLALCLGAAGLRGAAYLREDEHLAEIALLAPVWAGLAALLVRAYVGPRFVGVPAAPDDDPEAVAVKWLDAPPGAGRPGAERRAHDLPQGLRIVGGKVAGRELVLVAVAAVVGAAAMGWFGAPAALAVAWAFGFPRRARIAAEVPWESVAEVVRSGREHFRIRRSDGGADIVLEARYSHATRLSLRLSERIGPRLRLEGLGLVSEVRPAVLQPAEGDEDAGVAELIVRRARGQWTIVVALAAFGLAAVTFVAAHVVGNVWLRVAAACLGLVGGLFALSTAGSRGALWRGPVPAPDDAPDPVPVRWTNRPGWPGPGPQQAHVLPGGLRVVAFEWETWDVLVVVAASLAGIPVYGWLAAGVAMTLFSALGIPRRRRYAIDMAWTDVVRVEIRGTEFEIRTDLAAPADLVRLEAKYSARERLTAALVERLGDRAVVASPARRTA